MLFGYANFKRGFAPFLLFLFLNTYTTFAQQPSFGAGIGINSLRLVQENKEGNTATLSPLQMSLNIDYNFPNQTNIKWLKKIYNPIYSSNKLQLRVQAMINQFRIKAGLGNSLTSLGASMLYFPWSQDPQKKANSFLELGYKGGFSNISNDPFHSLVLGTGSRYKVGNDWFIQLNISYTIAFNDYLDRMGVRGLSWASRDGYFLANVSLLKSFHTQDAKKQIDLARDSLAMSKTLAVTISQKSTNLLGRIKLFNIQLQEKELKAQKDLETVLKLQEGMKEIAEKLQTINPNDANDLLSEKVLQEMETLKTQFSILDLKCFFEKEAINNELSTNSQNNIDIFYNDFQQDIVITKQLLWQSKAFMPKNKMLKDEVSNLFVINEASMLLAKCDTEANLIQTRLQDRQNLMKKILGVFENINVHKKIINKNFNENINDY
jgi:hypothetical protein